MTLLFIRIFFIIISLIVGYQLGAIFEDFGWLGAFIGFLAAISIVVLEGAISRVSVRGLSSAVFGLIFGLIMAKLVSDSVALLPLYEGVASSLRVIITLIFCYLGMVIALRGKDEFNVVIPYVRFARQNQKTELVLLDTSIIIDGRIADISQTKFLEGRFVIPKFVLKELQTISDSQDSIKRNRGRRGLDILNKIRKDAHLDVKISEEDFPEIGDVDAKLIKLAKLLGAKIFTTDYNLNKVAEIHGVSVLNINDLANSLKQVVLPGEILEVRLLKEGKEYNQAVAYLDDGTMVVVENARTLIGQTIKANVTSVLQTSAGRMIFAKQA